MVKKYYAVREGNTTGIFDNWEETKVATQGYSKAIYKGFKTLEEAETFMSEKDDTTKTKSELSVEDINKQVEQKISNLKANEAVIFVDGSFSSDEKRYGFGSVIITQDYEESFYKSGNEEKFLSSRNVAGEILGVIDSLEFCLDNNITKAALYYDYEGIEKWGKGSWRAKTPISKEYIAFLTNIKDSLDTQMIPDINNAKSIIKVGLAKINDYYIKF